ncbi:MAG: nitric oxide dioxygenase, partial [Anoxybacillus ayderensis]|nr:nitric oxide dioxygenase [Anoxybacillus ayderensis]
ITPLLSMAKAVAKQQPNRPITFVCAAVHGRVHAFDQELRALVKQGNVCYHVCYEQPSSEDCNHPHFEKAGLVDAQLLQRVIKQTNVDVYMCGPIPFMKAVKDALRENGISEQHIHYEFFGPASQL